MSVWTRKSGRALMPALDPLVSVLLPAFNAARFLGAAVASIQRQTLPAWELLLLDDGSEDETARLAEAFACADPRIRAFRFPHRGIAQTLNEGLARARGLFVARMDADDVSHPLRLSLQKDFLERNPSISVVGSLVRLFPRAHVPQGMLEYERWVNGLVTPEEIAREIFVDAPLVHPSVMMRREVLESVGGYRCEGPEDFDLWLRLHLAGKRFAKIPRVLLFWRERLERSTRRSSDYSREAFRSCRAQHLAEWMGPGRSVLLAGNREAKRLAKLLEDRGVKIRAFVDLDPARIGRRAHGIPVIGYDEVGSGQYAGSILLAAVGSRGAREEIRRRLLARGCLEQRDFVCVA